MSDGLKLDLCEIDNGRFEDVVHAIGVKDVCGQCGYFNPTIKDPMKRCRCYTMPGCIAATLHPNLQSYLWWKLGWIEEAEHHANLSL